MYFETGLTGTGGTSLFSTNCKYPPSFTQNGNSIGVGVNPWVTGYHDCAIIQLPTGVQINPGDSVTMTTIQSWMSCSGTNYANAVTNFALTNNSGQSCFGTENLVKTFKPGLNFSDWGTVDATLYIVAKNWRLRSSSLFYYVGTQVAY